MINKTCSPTLCGGLPSRHSIFRIGFIQHPRVSVSIAFTLFCLALSVSSASSQVRPKRAGAKPEERSQSVVDKTTAGTAKTDSRNNARQAVGNPLVRKTAMIYSPPTKDQGATNSVLVNDIIIISRASDEATTPVGLPTAVPRAAAGVASIPSIWPVTGPLTDGFGVRGNPFGGSSSEFHKGQDISAPRGTPVRATADGYVVIAGWKRGYGWVVYINHDNGVSTRYGHLSRIDVMEGQTIKQGEQLGLVGTTGRSTGPHLHYEVRINDQPINPIPYLRSSPSPIVK